MHSVNGALVKPRYRVCTSFIINIKRPTLQPPSLHVDLVSVYVCVDWGPQFIRNLINDLNKIVKLHTNIFFSKIWGNCKKVNQWQVRFLIGVGSCFDHGNWICFKFHSCLLRFPIIETS